MSRILRWGSWAVLALIATGCQWLQFSQHERVVPKEERAEVDSEELSRLVINFALKMKVEKHLELEDSWSESHDSLDRMTLRFSSQRLLTVYDARLLLVEVVEEFLSRLNQNSILRHQLWKTPFEAGDLDVKINFESYYGRYIDEKYVGCVWLNQGMVYFYAFDAKDHSYNGIDWRHFRIEPYAKSRELALLKREADLGEMSGEMQDRAR